jgi:integrase
MMRNFSRAEVPEAWRWQMPIVPEDYDRSPLTDAERQALEHLGNASGFARGAMNTASRESFAARSALARLDQPLTDIFRLRHQDRNRKRLTSVHFVMHREMYRHGKPFWDWSADEWMDTLRPTSAVFDATWGRMTGCRITIMDAAYLLAGISDLRPVEFVLHVAEAANTYFGAGLVTQQCRRVLDALVGKGYRDSPSTVRVLRQYLSLLFVLNRSPYLEDLSEDLLALLDAEGETRRWTKRKITLGLQHLGILPPEPMEPFAVTETFDSTGMDQEWYAWCLAWFRQEVDLTPRVRKNYMSRLLAVGRWLQTHAPDICTPEQWTEELALRFRSDLCSWTNGQYGSKRGQWWLQTKDMLGKPLQAHGLVHYLKALSHLFSDLTRRPHSPHGEPARRIRLDFVPGEVFTTPDHIRKILDTASPRDIDLQVWSKLTIAAATLAQSDLPPGTRYSLIFYRALSLVWVTSARRPNEIARLRLDCLREDWEPTMLGEEGLPVEKVTMNADREAEQEEAESKPPKISYLQIPAGKNRGPFWIWLPDYTADAINAWKRERPPQQRKLLDRKDREEVDYLFCFQDLRVGASFINSSVIPVLCKRAGVSIEDAKGKITGHRGRSARLTLLRKNGVSLDDLAEYAGHVNTRTIRRYARQDPIQLHQTIQAADDLSRIIEGVIDMQAAAQGLPALRWFIGYDADGEPMFCGNQVYVTCEHRLDCKRCGMFIGGEKARLLQEGEQTLPVTSKVPMTPLEKCVVEGDQAGAEACRAALQQVPAPETPDLSLIFNPEGLSNHELKKLAELATAQALDKLRQALDAHEKRLAEVQQNKNGRSALVGGRKKQIRLIQQLIAECEQRMDERQGGA